MRAITPEKLAELDALVAELRVARKAVEITAAPFRLFCHNVDGRPRCPLYTFIPPSKCGPDIQPHSDECKRLRIEHAYCEARTQLEADRE